MPIVAGAAGANLAADLKKARGEFREASKQGNGVR